VSLAYPGSRPRRAGGRFVRYGEAESLHPRRQVGDRARCALLPLGPICRRAYAVYRNGMISDCGWTCALIERGGPKSQGRATCVLPSQD
jgi:hypothetical protein